MKVSLFRLFLRHTSLIEPWLKLVWLVLLVFDFIWFYQFYVSLGDNWCCLICFTYTSLPTHVCPSSRHDFQYMLFDSDLSMHVCLSMHTTWPSLHHFGEFWLPWIRMSRSRSLKLMDSLSCWSYMRSRSMDHLQTIQSPFHSGPLLSFRVFLFLLVSAFRTVDNCISLCILAFAPIGDVLFL